MSSHILAQKALIWSSCPELRYRDGKKAVEAATRACELAQWKAPFALGCLAAACAENGDFDAAVKWEKKAIELIADDEPLRTKHRQVLALFEKKQPYRDQGED